MLRYALFEYWVVCKSLLRRLRIIRRSTEHSVAEYSARWKKRNFLRGYPELYMKGTEWVLLRRLERYRSVVAQIQSAMIGSYPRRVLEMGCGSGVNIVALALLASENAEPIHFVGIDLSEEGIAYGNALVEHIPEELFVSITGLSPAEVRRRAPRVRELVSFEKRDITATGLADTSFDFVFTHVAIEQLPRNYGAAFSEAFRVLRSGGRALFIEEFAEAQRTLLQNINVWAEDYFRASFRVVKRYGFSILGYERAEYQKYRLGTGKLLVEKLAV